MQSRPDQIVVLSIDYDSCGDDLFTNGTLASIFLDGLRKLIAKASRFENVEVHVYVGSARQDIATDEEANRLNLNGSCFENYPKLCTEQGWTFQPLLLADKQHNLPGGTAIKNKQYRVKQFDRSKTDILQIQLDDITSKFPNTPIEFVFIDDDAYGDCILYTNAEHFRLTLPEKVSLKLVQYNYEVAMEINKYRPSSAELQKKMNLLFIERFQIKSELSFDPTNISNFESISLNQILVSCVKNGNEIFYPGSTYVGELNIRDNQPLRKEFKLTGNFAALYFRPCSTTSYGYRFEIVSNNQLGDGCYGTIYDGITTLIPQYDGSLALKINTNPQRPPRVHKYFINRGNAKQIQHLSNNNKHARHLRVKQLTFHAQTDYLLTSFAAMKKIPGKDLWAILDENKLNTQQSISLALSILYAYRDQLHAYQLVHGDIKPNNLLIAYTKPTTTHFVDFDFCKLASTEDHRLTGGAQYMPPEFSEENYRSGTTPASDRYALGLTIGEIFFEVQDYWQSFNLDFNRCKPFDISNDEKYSLTKCITLMMDADPAKRCSIDAAIEIFEQLELKRLPKPAEIQSHYEQAAAFSKSMREAFAGKPASSENIIAFLQWFIQEMGQQSHNEINPALSDDSKQFVAKAAGLSAFPRHSKLALIQLASQLLTDYQAQESDIEMKINRLADIADPNRVNANSELANIALQIRQFLSHVAEKRNARAYKYALSLEDIQIICRKSCKEYDQLSRYHRTFKKGLREGYNYFSSLSCLFFKPMIIERNQNPKPACAQETAVQTSHAAQSSGLLSAFTYNIERENPAAKASEAYTYPVVRPQ